MLVFERDGEQPISKGVGFVIKVQKQDFDIGAEVKALTKGRTDIGAIVTFTGTVRDGGAENPLVSMTLEHYPGMTEGELARIEGEAQERWPLQASLIIHRYGELKPGENIVLVVTASRHRQAAFDAASYLMDFLKTNAPFWKKETGADGENWVAAKSSDDDALDKWAEDNQN